jgi:hypothetical protein
MSAKRADAFAREAECVEIDPWAAEAILDAEILTPMVIDPCCGPGIMAMAAERRRYVVRATDLHDWGFGQPGVNFLSPDYPIPMEGHTAFMNPPFSVACEFVDQARRLGARKIVCFQRWAWRECGDRRAWWDANPPQRVYVCGDRAHCWRVTIPKAERKGRTSSTAHAFYVWEQGQPAGPIVGSIWKKRS